jgi:hypothetical protein
MNKELQECLDKISRRIDPHRVNLEFMDIAETLKNYPNWGLFKLIDRNRVYLDFIKFEEDLLGVAVTADDQDLGGKVFYFQFYRMPVRYARILWKDLAYWGFSLHE